MSKTRFTARRVPSSSTFTQVGAARTATPALTIALSALVAVCLIVCEAKVLSAGGHGLPMAMISAGALVGAACLLSASGLLDHWQTPGQQLEADSWNFRDIADSLPVPVVLTTADCEEVLFANALSRDRFRIDRPVGGARPRTDNFYPDDDSRRLLALTLGATSEIAQHEMLLRTADGSTCWALVAARRVTFDGEAAVLASYYDITDRKAAEEALLASEVRYALISRASHDGIWDWDMPTGHVYYSARWREIAGASGGKRLSTLDDWFSRAHPDDLPGLRHAIEEHLAGRTPQLDFEYRMRHGDGRYLWMHCCGIVLRGNDGAPIRMAGSQADITLRKTYESHLRNAAYEDHLTGLNNRGYFTELVASVDQPHKLRDTALLLLNIDQFRRINDNLGMEAGDALLIAVARRLTSRVTRQDCLARLGADEFAVWLRGISDPTAIERVVQTILGDLLAPVQLGQSEVTVTVAIGVAVAGIGDATNGAGLLHNARLALDRAKAQGVASVLFDEALLRETKERLQLTRDLVSAAPNGEIYFDYQPVMRLNGDRPPSIAGFEALMRWRHPTLGVIPPGRFIPLAEESGIIGALGLLAIEETAREIERWTRMGIASASLTVAVNLSVRQIADPASARRLYDLLDRLEVPPGAIKLEITESVLMSDPEAMGTVCHELRRRGIELSLDDFGTGFSSLSYLHRYPFKTLKIDRSFISRITKAPEALRLVRSIIELAHDLGLEAVAEGVETADEADLLCELGCDFGQGYFFARPMSSEKAEAFLRSANQEGEAQLASDARRGDADSVSV